MADTKKLIGNTDASVWADEWCETALRLTAEGQTIIDWGWMIGWFANAIMAGFDEGYEREKRDMTRLKYALDHGWNRAQYEFACEKDLWEDDKLSDILPAIKPEALWELAKVPVAVPLGDATEYELLQGGVHGVPVAILHPVENPVEHLYADEDVAQLAQLVEDYRDVIGDLLTTVARSDCEYDETEWCTNHAMGRPCSVETGRKLLNG